jgi:hypothetical protein
MPIIERIKSALAVRCSPNVVTARGQTSTQYSRDLGFVVGYKDTLLLNHRFILLTVSAPSNCRLVFLQTIGFFLIADRYGEDNLCPAPAFAAFNPYLSAVRFDYSSRDGKSHPGSRGLPLF